MKYKSYLAIDLKSFYASVECIERGLDPLTTNLVVADVTRTEKTICLAVSPSLKKLGVSSRPRLFEVIQSVKKINSERLKKNNFKKFTGKSFNSTLLESEKCLELDYIAATPQMSHYIAVSNKIYKIYLEFFSAEDIHVYSIDEVFIDITDYYSIYHCTPVELATKVIKKIFQTTGITATCGIGTNLFLAKVAMDILAKHAKPNAENARIASLDEMSFRKIFWEHKPLTDFWRIGPGTQRRLNNHNMFTLGDVALQSLKNEDLLYDIFGVNAELIIDHAWGYEPTTIKEIKNYRPISTSISIGQVLTSPYDYNKTKIIVQEMSELLVEDLIKKEILTDQIVLSIGYDKNNNLENYQGELAIDYYGKIVPYPAHGSINLPHFTSSISIIKKSVMRLFENIINPQLFTRRINIAAVHTMNKYKVIVDESLQLNMFEDANETLINKKNYEEKLKHEDNLENTLIKIKNKYGKNSILNGTNLLDGATTKERNKQIGGHKA